MALDFKKIKGQKGGRDESDEGARQPRPSEEPASGNRVPARWHGRSCPPPPPGSGWTAFLDWACEGAFDHSPQDAALAMRFWTGEERSDQDDAVSPAGPTP